MLFLARGVHLLTSQYELSVAWAGNVESVPQKYHILTDILLEKDDIPTLTQILIHNILHSLCILLRIRYVLCLDNH
jgi:hypothetical protein